jgi:hypothetical protein
MVELSDGLWLLQELPKTFAKAAAGFCLLFRCQPIE